MLFPVLPHTTTNFLVMPAAFSSYLVKPAAVPTKIRSDSSRSSLGCSPRAVMVAQNVKRSYWAAIEAEIEAHLKKALPVRPPGSVFEPLRCLALAAPRTTALALCIAACELVGGEREQAMDVALAIHLMHAATYTHRQLLLSNRPGPNTKPTIEHKFGPNIELLTGDNLIPFGMELLAQSMDYPTRTDPDKIVRVIIEITRATGSQGVLDAVYREIESEKMNDAGGGLNACGAACGAIIGGGSEEEIERLRKYGVYVEMIHGMNEKEKIKEWEVLGMKELEIFKGKEVEQISSLLQPDICRVHP